MADQKFISIDAAAKRLSVHRSDINRARDRGALTDHKMPNGRSVRLLVSEVDQLFQSPSGTTPKLGCVTGDTGHAETLTDFKAIIDQMRPAASADDVAAKVDAAFRPRLTSIDENVRGTRAELRGIKSMLLGLAIREESDDQVEKINTSDWKELVFLRLVLDPLRELSPKDPEPNLQFIELRNSDHDAGRLTNIKLYVSDDWMMVLDGLPLKQQAEATIKLIGQAMDGLDLELDL